MITLVYVSAAVALLNDTELSELLAVSRRNNARRNLTGMLCYADGNFMQALEGEEDAVNALVKVLKADPRHSQMIELVRYPISARLFENWSMALNRIGNLRPEDQASCTALMNLNLPTAAPGLSLVAAKLLNHFRETMT